MGVFIYASSYIQIFLPILQETWVFLPARRTQLHWCPHQQERNLEKFFQQAGGFEIYKNGGRINRILTLVSKTLNSFPLFARQTNLQRSRGETPAYMGTHSSKFPFKSVKLYLSYFSHWCSRKLLSTMEMKGAHVNADTCTARNLISNVSFESKHHSQTLQ